MHHFFKWHSAPGLKIVCIKADNQPVIDMAVATPIEPDFLYFFLGHNRKDRAGFIIEPFIGLGAIALSDNRKVLPRYRGSS